MQSKLYILKRDSIILDSFCKKFPLYKNLCRINICDEVKNNLFEVIIFYDSVEGLCKFFKKFGRYSLTYDLNELDINPRQYTID